MNNLRSPEGILRGPKKVLPAPTQPTLSPIRYLKGIGPKRALALEKLGIRSIRDLLYYFPRRYEDRSHFRKIGELKPGETATLKGEILKVVLRRIRSMLLLEVLAGDETGVITAVWFNQPYLKSQFSSGQKILFHGRVDLYQNRLQINTPEYEVSDESEEAVHTGRITPVYPLTEGLFQRSLRTTLWDTVHHHLDSTLEDFLPEGFRRKKDLLDLRESVREMHFPSSFEMQSRAKNRLVFDEFLIFELALLQKIEKMRSLHQSFPLPDTGRWKEAFQKALPFASTQSQLMAFDEVAVDLAKETPMNRLLQGDVGSGKTVVAAFGALLAAMNKKQAVILVPTEILAEQHARTLRKLLEPFDLRIALLTSSTPAPGRERLVSELRQGKIQILIGTHAVLQDDIQFSSLAFVVIDEQHKFGVHQRCQLFQRKPRPHQLVMTATPIPRTLAMTLYADLDVSLMRERPAARQPVKTFWVPRKEQPKILNAILEKIQKGEQAYFIFPAVEETEKSDLLAATQEYENLRKGVFSKVKMGLVHGRLSREEREPIMKAFRNGELQLLVATSVIEVGVDNPNATLMVIENADHFGLAQLHQMRGRIGRGDKPSECFLFGEPKTDEAKSRLELMTRTQDGFLIAEEDLKLRGPGDFWGTRQSGEPLFRLAHPVLDQAILLDARKEAQGLLTTHALQNSPEWQGLKKNLEEFRLRY